MQSLLKTLTVICVFFISTQLVGQEYGEPTYINFDITLKIDNGGEKTSFKLASAYYNIGAITGQYDKPLTRAELINISCSGIEIPMKSFLKIFESQSNRVNGTIEIKDKEGKLPKRMIEFKKGMFLFGESFMSENAYTPASINFSIYPEEMIIDGISIYSK